jgi:predicted Zn-dependent peptidase
MAEQFFKKTVLPSGLTVYHWYGNRPWFYARLLCDAGQRRNPSNKIDLAHFVEHLLHTGISGFKRRNIIEWGQWLKQRGVNFNFGETDTDFAAYGGQALSRQDTLFFRVLSGLARRPLLDAAFDQQRAIIRAERLEAGPARVLAARDRLARHVFGDSWLARAQMWATDEQAALWTPEDVRRFHQLNYGLNGMRLVVMGGLKEKRLLQLLDRYFPAWPQEPPLWPAPNPPALNHARYEDYCPLDKGGQPTSVTIDYTWHFRYLRGTPLNLLAEALEDLLMLRLREKARLAYGVDVLCEHSQACSYLTVFSEIDPTKVKAAREIIEATLTDREAIARELVRQQAIRLVELQLRDLTAEQVLEEAAHYVGLNEEPLTDAETVEAFRAATPEQSLAILDRRLKLDRGCLQLIEW